MAYIRLTWERCCTSSTLQPVSKESLRRFVSFLEESGKYAKTLSTKDRVEYMAITLGENLERRRLFEYTLCDSSTIFGDEFKITILDGDVGADSEDTLIIVEGRNVWRKNVWVQEISSQFDLRLIDLAYSPNEDVKRWRHRVAFRCEVSSLCMCWGLNKMIEDVSKQVSARVLYIMCSYICMFMAESQGIFGPSTSRLSPVLWSQCSKLLCQWIFHTIDFAQEDQNCGLLAKFLPLLDFLNQMLNRCPNLKYFDFPQMVEALAACERHLVSCATNKDAEFLSFHLKRTLSRCLNSGRIIQETFSPFFSEIPGIVLPQIIGRGTFGFVYRCFDLVLNKTVAVKEIRQATTKIEDSASLLHEANCLKYLRHGNIVEVHGVFFNDNIIYIKMEYCTGGTLKRFIKEHGPLRDGMFRAIAFGILHGMYFLHGNNIIHGDLKPSNILKNQFDHVRLVDFGAAQQLAQTGANKAINMGTAKYAAPELLLNGQVSLKSDIWSLGCTFFYMATGLNPWSSLTIPGVILSVHSKQLFDLSPLRNSLLDPRAIKLIESCLAMDPTERPFVSQLQMNDYFLVGHG